MFDPDAFRNFPDVTIKPPADAHAPETKAGKAKIPAGRVFTSPVISLGILPTALAAAGMACPDNLDGVNLLPYIGDSAAKSIPADKPHDALFWRWGSVRAARVGDWKMVCRKDQAPMLFDLSNDIGEQNDLAAQQPDKLRESHDAWADWNKRNVPPKWTYVDKPKNRKAE